MAKQQGIIQLRGTIGGVTFSQTQYGNIARSKPGVSSERILTDPAYVRTRENNSEWGRSSTCGRYLRDAIISILHRAKDRKLHTRMQRLLYKITQMDPVGIRGQRSLAAAFEDPAVRMLLRGFEFNERTPLSRLLMCPSTINHSSGAITLPQLDVKEHLDFPSAATHAFLKSAWVKVDFTNGNSTFSASTDKILARNAALQDVILAPAETPHGNGVTFFFLRIGFSQVVNGVFYPMQNEGLNALSIVEVG